MTLGAATFDIRHTCIIWK